MAAWPSSPPTPFLSSRALSPTGKRTISTIHALRRLFVTIGTTWTLSARLRDAPLQLRPIRPFPRSRAGTTSLQTSRLRPSLANSCNPLRTASTTSTRRQLSSTSARATASSSSNCGGPCSRTPGPQTSRSLRASVTTSTRRAFQESSLSPLSTSSSKSSTTSSALALRTIASPTARCRRWSRPSCSRMSRLGAPSSSSS